jgi:hypothetical protein
VEAMYNHSKINYLKGIMPLQYLFPNSTESGAEEIAASHNDSLTTRNVSDIKYRTHTSESKYSSSLLETDSNSTIDNNITLCSMCGENIHHQNSNENGDFICSPTTKRNTQTKKSVHPAIENVFLMKSIKAFAIFILVYFTTFPVVTQAFRKYFT